MRKSQTVSFTLERAPRMARLDLQSPAASGAGGGGVHRRRRPRHRPQHVRAAGRPPPGRGAQGRATSRSPTGSICRGGAPHARRRAGARRGAGGTLLVTSDAGGDVYVDGRPQGRRARHHHRRPRRRARRRGAQGGAAALAADRDRRRRASRPRWRPSSAPPRPAAAACASSPASPTSRSSSTARTRGKAPRRRSPNIKPGEHIVEARKARFKPDEQTVHGGGRRERHRQLRMEVAPPDRPHARLKVQSTVPNAEVFLDGSSLGRAPVDRNDLDPGKHYIVVHKDGYTDFKREVVLVENQADGAGRRPVGDRRAAHPVDARGGRRAHRRRARRQDARSARRRRRRRPRHRVRLKGYFDHKETMKVEGGREKVFSVDLKLIPTGPTPEQVRRSASRGCRRSAPRSTRWAASPPTSASATPTTSWRALTVGRLQRQAAGPRPGRRVPDLLRDLQPRRCTAGCSWSRPGRCRWPCAANLGGGTGINGRDTVLHRPDGRSRRWRSATSPPSRRSVRYSGWTDQLLPDQRRSVDNGVSAGRLLRVPDRRRRLRPQPLRPGTRTPTGFSGSRLYVGLRRSRPSTARRRCSSSSSSCPFPSQFSATSRARRFEGQVQQRPVRQKDHLRLRQAGVTLKF